MGAKKAGKNLAFGRELRRLREQRGLSQSKLASLIPCDSSYISKAENGQVPAPEFVRAWDQVLEANGQLVALLAVQGAARPAQLPAAAARFVGRDDELARLDQLIVGHPPDGSPTLVTIDGIAGVGKTTLALRWAHHAARSFAGGQLYIDLRGYSIDDNPVRPQAALEEFLTALGVPSDAIPATVKQRAALYRSLVADQALLIVLDNAANSAQVEPLLPGSAACAVLVTSRNQLSGLAVSAGARRVTLGPLNSGESVALITQAIGSDRAAAEPAAVAALAKRCGHLPLAVRIAAERVATRPHQPVSELEAELTSSDERLDGLDVGDSIPVRTVFSWSYKDLDAPTARMWRLLGLHPGLQISTVAAAAVAGVTKASARRLLDRLAGVHLLETAPGGQFQFHDLLRDYAAELATATETKDQRTEAVRRLTDFYLHCAYNANVVLAPERVMPLTLPAPAAGVVPLEFSGFAAARDWCDQEVANFVPVIRLAAAHGCNATGWQLAAVLWNYLLLRRPWHVWGASHRVALECAHKAKDPGGESWMLNNLAHLLRLRRTYDRAEEFYEQALAIRRDIGDRFGQAWTLVGLGTLNAEQGRPTKTCGLAATAHGLFAELGYQHGQGVALCVMADAHRDLEEFDDALRCLTDALSVWGEVAGPRGQGHVLTKLGGLHRRRGEFDTARQALEQALVERRHAEDRAGEAETLMCLGEVLGDLGEQPAARHSLTKALEIFTELDDVRAGDVRALLGSAKRARAARAAEQKQPD